MIRNFVLILCFAAQPVLAATLTVSGPEAKNSYYEQAIVWEKPEWIDEQFRFSESFDIAKGPALKGNLQWLRAPVVSCLTSDEDQDFGRTGMTSKFYCQLLAVDPATGARTPLYKKNGRREKIKVKYTGTEENPEVYSEILGTRLLWALGFAADRMYPVETLHCHGCSADPFTQRKVDPTTLENPRVFVRNAVENKFAGDSVRFEYVNGDGHKWHEYGWTFKDLMRRLPQDPARKARALAERDALRLLGIMIQHGDNKSINQRIVCRKADVVDGKCIGRPVFLIQDLGATFGLNDDWGKLDYRRWIRDPIWKDPSQCVAQFLFPQLPDPSVAAPVISEGGRALLANLLAGLSEGPQGRARVKALFTVAGLDKRQSGETVDMWVEAFLAKVEEIRFPLGRERADFRCPNN